MTVTEVAFTLAVVGILGTLAATVLGPYASGRREELTWRRQQQFQVYVDALTYAGGLSERWLQERSIRRDEPLPPFGQVAARLYLVGEPSVRGAWEAVAKSSEKLSWWAAEIWEGEDSAPTDLTDDLRLTIAALVALTQKAVNNG